MGRYERLVEHLQVRIEHAETADERRAALDELEIVAELAHLEHDRALERAAEAVLAGAGV